MRHKAQNSARTVCACISGVRVHSEQQRDQDAPIFPNDAIFPKKRKSLALSTGKTRVFKAVDIDF